MSFKYLDKNKNKISNYKNKIISFDIFDTLITRSFVQPENIFLLIQKKINSNKKFLHLPSFLKENYLQIRKNIDSYTQKNKLELNNQFECTFDEIYECLRINYSLSPADILNLKQLEIECEKSNLLPIVENIDLLKNLKKNNTIILTSDMYFSKEILHEFLISIDSIFENIEIYSSSDLRFRKSNGTTFKYLKECYLNKEIIHIGDNKDSDYYQASWNNIDSYLVLSAPLERYEKNALERNNDNLILNLSIGISKYIRSTSLNDIYNLGASFAAPILYGYVDWLLEDAIKNEIKNLYFVARDGYIPKIIADIIIKIKKYDIKTHYFFSSRRASRFCDENNYSLFINWIFSELQNLISIEYLSERLNIELDKFSEFFKCENIKQVLNTKKRNEIKEILLNSDELKSLIINANKIKKNIFLSYVEQEIDFSKKFAFVDINGSGRTQDNLCQLIQDKIKSPVYSYYFHLQTDMKQNNLSIKKAYFHSVKYSNILLELLSRTVHGQTLGYQKVSGKVVPILEYEKNEFIEKWGYNDYLNAIIKYSELFSYYKSINNLNSNSLDLYISYSDYYKYNLDKKNANIIGNIPFGFYGNEKNIKECAPAYNLFNIFNIISINKYISLIRNPLFPCLFAKLLMYIFTKTNYGYISKKQNIAYLKIFNYKINIKNILWS